MKAPASISTTSFESHIWIRPEGRGTFLESPTIKSFIESSVEEGSQKFVIDLEACSGMDSTFMGMLAGLGIGFRKSGKGQIFVVGTSAKTRASLKELGLQYLMKIEPAEGPWVGRLEEAREGLVPAEPKQEADKGAHILECHEDLCLADDANLDRFKTVLDMLGSDMTTTTSEHTKSAR